MFLRNNCPVSLQQHAPNPNNQHSVETVVIRDKTDDKYFVPNLTIASVYIYIYIFEREL